MTAVTEGVPPVAIVTGGAAGIGRGIVTAALAAGYRVSVGDRDAAALDRLVAEFTDGPTASNLDVEQVDVTDTDGVAQWRARIDEQFGGADVLVNNAGIARFGKMESLSVDDWRSVIETNLTAAFIVTQQFGAAMRAKRRGSIVGIASVGSVAPAADGGAYAPAKAGIVMLMQQFAVEWGPLGVRSNAVSPGMIHGGLATSFYSDPAVVEARQSLVPLKRLGTESDVANAVLWLWSDAASYVSGTNLLVDGAFTRTVVSSAPTPWR